MKNNKAFTLIELLAVIVILAIILAIAIPGISGIVKSSTMSSMKSDAKLVLKAVELKKLGDKDFNPLDYNSDLGGLLSALKLSGDNYESIVLTNNNDETLVTIEGKGKWDGLTACGSYHNMIVSEEGCELDFEPPVITLNGDNPMEVSLNDTYVEPGSTVSDNSGESIEAVITGSVNISAEGEYTITYTATDSSGNTTTMTRTVNVVIPSYAGPAYKSSKGVNGPLLTEGMTPIKRSGNTWIDTDIYDPDWYNYTTTDKQWANVRTNDCSTPGNIETCSMWVWIPRYAYQIATCYHLNEDQCVAATGNEAGSIDIKFLRGTTNTASDNTTVDLSPTYSGSTQTNYIKHPAFDFGDTPITGMWVAKFEMSGSVLSLGSKSGVASLRDTTLGNMFTASRNMETSNKYGWTLASGLKADGAFTTDTNNVDTHMMKNIEWGSVAYLAQSTYGKNAEITINNNPSYYTGGGSGIAYATNVGQSTTGTIYGIYDMSGGAYEYVMGNYNNTAGNSGIAPSSLKNKYIDRYPSSETYSASIYGDAIYETSSSINSPFTNSWYSDLSRMFTTSYPWFQRGDLNADGSAAGTFYFDYSNGAANTQSSWRIVVFASEGL